MSTLAGRIQECRDVIDLLRAELEGLKDADLYPKASKAPGQYVDERLQRAYVGGFKDGKALLKIEEAKQCKPSAI